MRPTYPREGGPRVGPGEVIGGLRETSCFFGAVFVEEPTARYPCGAGFSLLQAGETRPDPGSLVNVYKYLGDSAGRPTLACGPCVLASCRHLNCKQLRAHQITRWCAGIVCSFSCFPMGSLNARAPADAPCGEGCAACRRSRKAVIGG